MIQVFTKITDEDLAGKGVVGQPAVPGLSVKEMQESVEQIVREVAIPAINRLIEELADAPAAQSIGAQNPLSGNEKAALQTVLNAILNAAQQHASNKENPHAVTAGQTGAYTKSETDSRIDEKVVEIGAGDMAKAEYGGSAYGIVAKADKLASPVNIGNALFDESSSVTLAQMGAQPAVAYSKIEQPTGMTWIDGKPLFKRTFEIDLQSDPFSFDTGIAAGSLSTVFIGAESFCVYTDSSAGNAQTIYPTSSAYSSNETYNTLFFVKPNYTETVTIDWRGGTGWDGQKAYVTLYYTKNDINGESHDSSF